MTPSELSDKLAAKISTVARLLLPNGKKVGNEWRAGSLSGEEGKSLGVHLTGPKVGVWSDFATGQSGDVLDLWCAVEGVSIAQACRDVQKYLGIEEPKFVGHTQRAYSRPDRPACKPAAAESNGMAYLRGRKLSEAAISAYKVASNGKEIIFPSLRDGELLAIKYLGIDRVDGKKRIRVESDCEPCLFGWQAIPDDARTVVLAEGECLPGETEVLTVNGWVPLAAYDGGKVAQFDEGIVSWVDPVAKIEKHYTGDLVEYRSKGFVSVTTANHNLLSLDNHGSLYKHKAIDGPLSSMHRIPRVGMTDGLGIDLTDDQIRLSIAISADAHIKVYRSAYLDIVGQRQSSTGRRASFGFKKQRKIDRLFSLLRSCGVRANENPRRPSGYQYISFCIPTWVPGRLLPFEWIAKATRRQREMILEELMLWDGNSVPNRNQNEFSSKIKHNADFVQALAHTTGRVSSIIRRKNKIGRWFKVSVLHSKSTSSWQVLKKHGPTIIPHDGMVYCLTVPSGALLVRHEDVVTVTGNCDAMSWYTMGIPALSVPFGGGAGGKQRWIDNELPNLDRFDWIYVAMDEDKAGYEATREIVERLGVHRCKVVTFPNGFNDANEMLCAEAVTPEEFRAALIDTATTKDPEELRGADTYVDELIDIFHPGNDREPGFASPWEKFDEFRFRPGEVTILGGINGHGKSQIAGNIVLDAMRQDQRACIASMEFRADKMLGRLTRQATCRPDPSVEYIRQAARWYQDRLWVFDVTGTAKADRILEVFDYARRRYGIDLFVVDNLAKCGYAEDDYNGQKGLVDRMTDFVKMHDCHLILVVHLRKGMDESQPVGKFSVKGSGAITDMADSLLLIWRNKAKEAARKAELASGGSKPMPQNLADAPDTTLNCEKQRNGDSEPWASLSFDLQSNQFLPSENVSPKKYVQFHGDVA